VKNIAPPQNAFASAVRENLPVRVKSIAVASAVIGICLAIAGCSKENVTTPLQSNAVVGVWIISSAPSVVTTNYPTNSGVAQSILDIKPDGISEFKVLPVQQFVTPSPFSLPFGWTVTSGSGRWSLSDWGNTNRHAWRVDVVTPVAGIQLLVKRGPSNSIILAYTPDPDKEEESVYYKRK
jgi:hypothetical protein